MPVNQMYTHTQLVYNWSTRQKTKTSIHVISEKYTIYVKAHHHFRPTLSSLELIRIFARFSYGLISWIQVITQNKRMLRVFRQPHDGILSGRNRYRKRESNGSIPQLREPRRLCRLCEMHCSTNAA